MLSVAVFTGCSKLNKLFTSDEELAGDFRSDIQRKFNEESVKKEWIGGISVEKVVITESDGDEYEFDVTFTSDGNSVTVEGEGTYDGDYREWEISGKEMAKVYSLVVASLVKRELTSAASVTGRQVNTVEAEYVDGRLYECKVTFKDGEVKTGNVVFNDENGKIMFL